MTDTNELIRELNDTADYLHSMARSLRTPLGARLAQASSLLVRASEALSRPAPLDCVVAATTEGVDVPTPQQRPRRSAFGRETA